MYIFIIYYFIEISSHLSTQEVKKEKKKRTQNNCTNIQRVCFVYILLVYYSFVLFSKSFRASCACVQYVFRFSIFGVSRVLTRQELKPDSILDIRIGQEQRVKLADCDSCCNCRLCAFVCVEQTI